MANTFDRIKISLPFTGEERNSLKFKQHSEDGELTKEVYNEVGLGITINHIQKTIFIDFSAKHFGVNYVNKIGIDNIRDVYYSIASILQLSPKSFYSSEPKYCEVLVDLECNNKSELTDSLFSLGRLQNRYKLSSKTFKHKNASTSFHLIKNVNTKEIRDYMCIYDKANELFKSYKPQNIRYLSTLTQEEKSVVLDYFNDKLRFESKYNSKRMIRHAFRLRKHFTLYDLLTSEVPVIYDLLCKVYPPNNNQEKPLSVCHKDIDKMNTLLLYDFDLDKIYERHRLAGNKREKSKLLRPYRTLIKKYQSQAENPKVTQVQDAIRRIGSAA